MSTAVARFRFGQIADCERFLDRLEASAIRHTVTTTHKGATVEIDALPLASVIKARAIRAHLYAFDPLLDAPPEGAPASAEEQHGRYLDCGPGNWDDR